MTYPGSCSDISLFVCLFVFFRYKYPHLCSAVRVRYELSYPYEIEGKCHSEVQIVPVSERHALKGYRGHGDKTVRTLNLDTQLQGLAAFATRNRRLCGL
jgi:hypothetical protein